MPLTAIVDIVLDLIFPPKCHICKQPHPQPICPDCVRRVTYINNRDICVLCGDPRTATFSTHTLLCPKCTYEKPHFEFARSVAAYTETIKTAIHNFKFRAKTKLAAPLTEIMASYISDKLPEIKHCAAEVLITVPLSVARQKKRGYNQVDLLTEKFASHTNLPFEKDVLHRVKETKPQFDLPKEERARNVKNAFQVSCPEKVYGRKFLLLDDIYTTGHTVNECAKVLKQAGAKKVYVLTLSRALLTHNL